MEKEFSLEPLQMQKLAEIQELRDCNEISGRFGLAFSERQIQTLVEKRFEALKDTGRVEFGTGILKKLIYAFCDSPYIYPGNYEDTILELQDLFYYFKNESEDKIPDDDLIEFMKDTFDGKAQGSLAFLYGTPLEDFGRNARYGYKADDTPDESFEEDHEE